MFRTLRFVFGVFIMCSYSSVFAQSSTEHYTYDALGRLVVAKTVGGANNGEAHSICYDKSGNRTNYVATSNGVIASCVNLGLAAAPLAPPAILEPVSVSRPEPDSGSPPKESEEEKDVSSVG